MGGVHFDSSTAGGPLLRKIRKIAPPAIAGCDSHVGRRSIPANLVGGSSRGDSYYECIKPQHLVVDADIFDLSLALALETLGLSVVFGAGVVILNDLVAEHAAVGLKKSVPRVGVGRIERQHVTLSEPQMQSSG